MALRETRLAKGFTQEQLAERAGVDQPTISALETGKIINPSWNTVARLAHALGVDPTDIFPVNEAVAS